MTEPARKCPVGEADGLRWPSAATTRNPYAMYEQLHAEAPVYKYPGRDEYLVTRWVDLVQISTQTERFSSMLLGTDDPDIARPRGQEAGAVSILGDDRRLTPYPSSSSDPPEHRHKRALGLEMLTPKKLRGYEQLIRSHVEGYVDGWVANGSCDFRAEFSDLLPMAVVADIMGLPAWMLPDLREWSDLEAGGAARYATSERRAVDEIRIGRLYDYVRTLILELHQAPRPGFLSEMIASQIRRDGEFDLEFLVAEASLIIFAGNVTTAHLIASGMVQLCRDRGLAKRLRADPSLISAFGDEMLRLESPLQWTQRICTQDTVVGGVAIPAGAWVLMFWGAGNRDAETFVQPGEVHIDRPQLAKRQLGFGYGIHRCLGAPLARQEFRISFEVLLSRLANVRLLADESDLSNIESVRFRAPRRVRIAFESSGQS